MADGSLHLADLEAGDVLLLRDMASQFSHFGIALAQAFLSHCRGGHANITHAGLFGDGNIIEASGHEKIGLREVPIMTKDPSYTYEVWRCTDQQLISLEIPLLAYAWAHALALKHDVEDQVVDGKHVGFGSYDTKGCYLSMFGRSNRGGNIFVKSGGFSDRLKKLEEQPLHDRKFFCSNFVVECYELAYAAAGKQGRPAINMDYRFCSPKALQGQLKADAWKQVGIYRPQRRQRGRTALHR